MGLEVDLVEVDLGADGLPGVVQELVVGHARHILGPDIGRYLEVLILLRRPASLNT